MVDKVNAFGYDVNIPEDIREIFMWLCQDVAALQSKWDFYLELFTKKDNITLLSDLAPWSFNIIEESLRNDMTMSIYRLSDPSSSSEKNLSLARLVKKCSSVKDLDLSLKEFKLACESIRKLRNKKVGHNDFQTRINPQKNPLHGISKNEIERIIELASKILIAVEYHFSAGDLNSHTISRGGAQELIYLLKAGQKNRNRA